MRTGAECVCRLKIIFEIIGHMFKMRIGVTTFNAADNPPNKPSNNTIIVKKL